MARLRQTDRERAVTLLIQGVSQSEVARTLFVSRSTVSRLYQRLRTTGTIADAPRSGRPRETTRRQDRYMRLSHLRNRFLTAEETATRTPGRHNNRICSATVRHRLKEDGIKAYRPYVGLVLTRQRRNVRLDWLNRHCPTRVSLQRWRSVLFTDESRFSLFRADGRQRVYRRKGERFDDSCVVERDRFGGGSVMVWGGISYGRKTPLVVINGNMDAVKYRDSVLEPHVVPFVRRHNLTFQQDNARPHVARLCRDFLARNEVVPLEWPPYSPDMSPIEHLWDDLDRRVRKRPNPPSNVAQLTAALIEEWGNIPVAIINKLMNSMHRRIRAARKARGGHTRY